MADEAGTSSAGATTSTTPSSRYFQVFLNFRRPESPDSPSTVSDDDNLYDRSTVSDGGDLYDRSTVTDGGELYDRSTVTDGGELYDRSTVTDGDDPPSPTVTDFLLYDAPPVIDNLYDPSTVIDALYDAFLRAGIRVFYDNGSMRQGSIVDGELMEAIASSSIYILIFSEDYAYSKWCLLELEKIVECWEDSQEREDKKMILPIFYDLNATGDPKLQRGVYTAALQEHKDLLGEDVVKPWEIALSKAAKIKGWNIHDHGPNEITRIIVGEVCRKLWTRSEPKKVPHDYVGMDDPMNDIMRLLDLDSQDVRFVAIHGTGGVGKTTLARLVFNSISSCFQQGVAFLSDVGEKSRTAGVVNLQRDLLSQLGEANLLGLTDAEQGVMWVSNILKNKKVVIVLDGLDEYDQLLKLTGETSSFGIGSRVVITTKNVEIITQGEGFYPYKMREMKPHDALKLFSRRVFDSDSPPVEYHKISTEVVDATGCLPLAINIKASVFRYNMNYARGTLEKLKKEVHIDEAGTSSSGTTTSRKPSRRDFEVFLNFRGPDSRFTIIDVLHDALIRAGICVFCDDESIRKERAVDKELMEAITSSSIYILIFSRDYASSCWCLRELEKIIKCWEDSQEGEEYKTILPIFYDVDESDLRLRSKVYTTALQQHKELLGEDVVKPWENALSKAARIKGWYIREHGLVKLVELMVEKVCCKLSKRSNPDRVPDDYVGIDGQIDEIMRLIDLDAHDVRVVSIRGIIGVGKTTLARLVYLKISSYFPQGVAFISDIRKKSSTPIVNLQEDLISQLLQVNSLGLINAAQGVSWIRERLIHKKVLIVLDDLKNENQLPVLVGEPWCFGMGSRVIITTSDIGRMLTQKSFYRFEMQEMNTDNALKLFSKKVFKIDSPPVEYDRISRKVVHAIGGLPLAINYVASQFRNNSIDTWETSLKKLKKVVSKNGREKLVSYHQLNYNEKEIFLDIACLFINKEIEDATYYWEAQQLYPKPGIKKLMNMSLIEIVDNKLQMDDILRNLGRNLVEEENDIPERRSRQWSPEEALSVVYLEKGTKEVLALNLGKLDGDCCFSYKQFARLTNLKFLELNGGNFENANFKAVFSKLRWLSWDNCPADFGATNLCFKNLNVLILSENLITDDWGGWHEIKAAKNLKVLKCTNCQRLTKSPEFSAFPQLKRLVFKNCEMLTEIDLSIGTLKRLFYLEITSLSNMRSLPNSIGYLRSLSVLKLELENLFVLPPSIGSIKNLKHVHLHCPKVPSYQIRDIELCLKKRGKSLDISGGSIGLKEAKI